MNNSSRLLAHLQTKLHRLPQVVCIMLAMAVCTPDRVIAESSPYRVRVITDKNDYAPGSTVQITAHGYLPGELVRLQVLYADGAPAAGADQEAWLAVADTAGDLCTTWHVCSEGCLNRAFELTATGQISGSSANTKFTDAAHLDSVVVGAQSPGAFAPGAKVTYPISFTSHGGGADSVTLSVISGLPSGATATFSPNPVDVSGTSTLTITTTVSTVVGTYPFTVRAVADVTVTATGTLTFNPPTPTPTNNGPICAGSTLTLSTATVAGGTYSWTGPNGFTSSAQNPSIANATTSASGTYSVTVTVNSIASSPGSTTATVNAPPVAPSVGNNGPICSGGTLSLTASTVAGATYSWTGPNSFTSSTQNPSIVNATTNASGTYSVTVTVSGCTSTSATTSATVNLTPAAPTAGNNGPVCAGSTLNLTASTVAGGIYSWTGPNSFTATVQNPSIASATTNASGAYHVTVTVNSCTSTSATTTATVNAIPAAPVPGNNGPICSGGTLSLSASAVTGGTDSWTGPNSFASSTRNPFIANATTNASGSYNVTVTVNGCTSTSATTVATVNAIPAAPVVGNNGPICAGNTLTLTASTVAGATYSWTGPNSFTSAAQNPSITSATTAASGAYHVTVTVNSCTSTSAATTATVNAVPAAPTVSNNGPICGGGTLTLTASTVVGGTYSWTGPNSFTSTNRIASIPSATTNATGSYSVNVTVNGCTSTNANTTATVNAVPAAPTAGNNGPVCAGSTLNLTASTVAVGTYSWTGPNSFTATVQNPSIAGATTNASGAYHVTVTVNSCTSTSATTTATVNAIPAAPVPGNGGSICEGSTLNLTASTVAGATYTWTGPNGFSSPAQNPSLADATTNASGAYSVTVTVNGCISTTATTVATVNAIPAAPAVGNNGPICEGSTLNLNASTIAGATYSWSGPNGFTSPAQNPSIVSATTNAAGTYSVTVTVNSCTSTGATTIATVNPIPAAPTAGNDSPTCVGGTLNLTASTIDGATYSWTGPNGFTSPSQNPSIAGVTTNASGTYSVTVTVNGCISTATTTIATINSAPLVTGEPASATNCAGQSVTFSVIASGNGLTYQWRENGSPISDGGTISGSASTNLLLTGVAAGDSGNSFDCVVSGTCSPPAISDAATLTVTAGGSGGSATATLTSLCLGDSTTITLSDSTGVIQWQSSTDSVVYANISNETNTSVNTGPLLATTYFQALLNSPCGLATSSVATVTVNITAPVVNAEPVGTNVCEGSTASFSVNATGNGTLGYAWRKRGTGWADGWTLNVGDGGFFTSSSTGNDNAQPTSNSGQDIDTGGSAWGLSNAGPNVTEALRLFNAPLSVGRTFAIDMDSGANGAGIVGFGLQDSASGSNRLEVYFVGGQTDYTINDANGEHDSGVPFTWAGINVLVRLTGTNTYAVTITRYLDGQSGSFAGTLSNTGLVDSVRLFDANGGSDPTNDLYFNNIRVASADDNAADTAYSGGWSEGANGGQVPLVNGGDIAGSDTSTLTVSPAAVADSGSYDVAVVDGCGLVTISSAAALTVNPNPTAFNVTGGGAYCDGGSGVLVELDGSQSNVNYQLQLDNVDTGSPVAGTGDVLSFGDQTAAGGYTVVANDAATGCISTMNSNVTVTINPVPTTFNVTGGGAYCAGGSGVLVGLDGSQSNVNYQLQIDNVATGSPVAGTGDVLSFGNQTAAGTYTVAASDATTGCTLSMAGNATVGINPVPTTFNVIGGGVYCAGGSGVLVGLDGSQSNVNYQLQFNNVATGSPVAGTGDALSFGNETAAGAYTVVATDDGTGCSSSMGGSATVTINPLPAVFNVTGGGAYCSGGSGVLVGLDGSVSNINYQLQINNAATGSPVAGTGAALSFGSETAAGTYTVVATDASTGCILSMAGSASVTVNPAPSCTVAPFNQAICAGGSQTFTVNPSGGTPDYTYLWSDGSTGPSLTTNAAGTYSVTVMDSNGCTTVCSATLTVNPLPAVFNVTGGGAYCAGGSGVAVGLDGSESGVSYQLQINAVNTGSPVTGNGGTLSFGNQTTSGNYTVVATNATTGCGSSMAGSATVALSDPFPCWQLQYFGCTNCPQAAATAVPDGDGQNNLAEFLAGTVPTNSASVLRITSVLPQGNDLKITWETAGGDTNALQATVGNPGYNTNFTDISGPIIITGSGDTTTNYTDLGGATNAPARFYRVRLVP